MLGRRTPGHPHSAAVRVRGDAEHRCGGDRRELLGQAGHVRAQPHRLPEPRSRLLVPARPQGLARLLAQVVHAAALAVDGLTGRLALRALHRPGRLLRGDDAAFGEQVRDVRERVADGGGTALGEHRHRDFGRLRRDEPATGEQAVQHDRLGPLGPARPDLGEQVVQGESGEVGSGGSLAHEDADRLLLRAHGLVVGQLLQLLVARGRGVLVQDDRASRPGHGETAEQSERGDVREQQRGHCARPRRHQGLAQAAERSAHPGCRREVDRFDDPQLGLPASPLQVGVGQLGVLRGGGPRLPDRDHSELAVGVLEQPHDLVDLAAHASVVVGRPLLPELGRGRVARAPPAPCAHGRVACRPARAGPVRIACLFHSRTTVSTRSRSAAASIPGSTA